MSLLKPLSRVKSCITNNYVEVQGSSIRDDAGDIQELQRDPGLLRSGIVCVFSRAMVPNEEWGRLVTCSHLCFKVLPAVLILGHYSK